MGSALWVPLRNGFEQQDGPGDSGVERAHGPAHWNAHEQVAPSTDGWPQALAFAPDDDHKRSAQVALTSRQGRIGLRARDAQPAPVEIGERAAKVADRAEQEVLHGACGRFDRGRRQRRLPAHREDHAMDAGRLSASQERSDVLGILERVEDQHERRLAALGGPGQDVVQRGELARLDDERDALVAIEAGQRGQRTPFELDDRNAQPGGVEHELLQGAAPLWDHEQPECRAPGRKGLLDRPAAGDELFLLTEQIRGGKRGHRTLPRSRLAIPAGPGRGSRSPFGSFGRTPAAWRWQRSIGSAPIGSAPITPSRDERRSWPVLAGPTAPRSGRAVAWRRTVAATAERPVPVGTPWPAGRRHPIARGLATWALRDRPVSRLERGVRSRRPWTPWSGAARAWTE